MKDFKTIIYEWVKENFGESEADNPSWSIEALAKHLSESDIDPDELNANTKVQAYVQLKDHYLDEDIEQLAEDKGLTFTKDEVARIKHQYYKMDDETWEQLSIIMDDIVMERGE